LQQSSSRSKAAAVEIMVAFVNATLQQSSSRSEAAAVEIMVVFVNAMLQQGSSRYISTTAPNRFIDAVKEDGETLTPDVLSERFQAFLQVRIVDGAPSRVSYLLLPCSVINQSKPLRTALIFAVAYDGR
jgi:hypothetical protein